VHTITLSTTNSARWDDTGPDGAAYRRRVVAEAQAEANRLGTSLELCHADGYVLEVLHPEPREE
jgi:hypothetical protein